jgi:hypothetical protein
MASADTRAADTRAADTRAADTRAADADPTAAESEETKLLVEEFEQNLKLCKEIEKTRIPCKFGIDCIGTTTKHYIDYTHPAQHQFPDADIEKYLECTYEFLIASRKIYDSNNRQLPNNWYTIIQHYLKESDYTKHDSLYFYLLSNMACNLEYIKKRFGKRFMSNVLIGMEEHAVTGMFKVQKGTPVQNCLYKLGIGRERNGTYYLSNTGLIQYVSK